ncbi:hypothetical protein PVAG01_04051 [Phlyctema vagabunda]|uniref:Uncharacterized protein n=1 Tax=Phlyctema vagabunda TaxID=108571 RepID=A0ABR4PN68_9HELO
MFSPPRREKAKESLSEDSHLPKGDCRYILLHPEVKGLRCACVGFALNRAIPGSTCDCGHQACYHTAAQEVSIDKQELQTLKEKISLLEDQLDRERHGGRGGLADRFGRLEELVDRKNAESETEMKSVYRGIGGLWHNVSMLNKRLRQYDDNIEGLVDGVQRVQNRLIDIDDASMRVEERVEALEMARPLDGAPGRRRKASTPPSVSGVMSDSSKGAKEEEEEEDGEIAACWQSKTLAANIPSQVMSDSGGLFDSDGSQAWTVHISLLPTSSQPFPFEKDTAAYKRCLSRGLHRVVAIPNTDSNSFVAAVSDAFEDILQKRKWMPLVARICDAKNLRGLPMLRELPSHLVGCEYDVEFLKANCAVVTADDKIDHLYIAMLAATLSWSDLRHSPCFLKGLESCWDYDPFLDGPLENDTVVAEGHTHESGSTEMRPAAGDILPWSPSSTRLKRTSSEISRTSSFGSSTESESTRAKLRRQCAASNVEVVGRRAEAV